MYSIRNQVLSFGRTSYHCIGYLNDGLADKRQVFVYSCGALNLIWQAWGKIWRTFWLAHILGGTDRINNHLMRKPLPIKSENEAIHHLLYLLGKRKVPYGNIVGSYLEPTWGDPYIIQNLATKMLPTPGTAVLGAFSHLGDAPKHLQKVRNAAVHLTQDSISKLKLDVVPYYAISQLAYPTDIIFAKNLSTGKRAIDDWVDKLISFISLI